MMSKKKKETLTDAAKETVGIGILSQAGLGAMGALANSPNMPQAAKGTINLTAGGLNLVGVGRLAKTGKTLVGSFEGEVLPAKKKAKPKSFAEERISKILG